MLELSVWRQYHEENSLREKLCGFYGLELSELNESDKELYAILKAKLTKKELRLFAMDSAFLEDVKMMEELGLDEESLALAKAKLYKKLKNDNVKREFLIKKLTLLEE